MVGFKKFVAMWLSVVVFVSVFTVSTATLLQPRSGTPEVEEPGFSVHWMGFFPGYSSQYPEYYICINNLKSDVLALNIALQIKNQEDVGYWFKADKYEEPPAGWTISPLEIGFVDVDETIGFTYPAYRSKPTSIPQGRLTETINLVIGAYHNASYTSLYSQDNFTVTFNFIDRMSPAWTPLYHDNFDGGTTQGWSTIISSASVSSAYYRSFPYSLRCDAGYSETNGFIKTFNVGTGEESYLILSLRSSIWGGYPHVYLDGTLCFKPDVEPTTDVWYQFTIPLPIGETTFKIYAASIDVMGGGTAYLDDVFVIAK